MDHTVLTEWMELETEGGSVVFGVIYNDENYKTGSTIRTSLVKSIDRRNGILKTVNSTYKLGTELINI